MLATERLAEIEAKFGHMVERIVPIELDGETLRLIIYLKDGTNLRITEQWEGPTLKRYSRSYFPLSVVMVAINILSLSRSEVKAEVKQV